MYINNYGTLKLTSSFINGAINTANLPPIFDTPIPIFRATVGYNSLVYIKIIPKEIVIKNFPIIVTATVSHHGSKK